MAGCEPAGWVLYLPEAWHHATVNSGPGVTLALARQPVAPQPGGFYKAFSDGVALHNEGKNLTGALSVLSAALLKADDAGVHLEMGRVLEKLGRIAEAIEAHRQAIESNGRCPAPWLELAGIAKDVRGEPGRAEDMLARARARGLKHPLL